MCTKTKPDVESANPWSFRIVMPTCNAYARGVVTATLQLLKTYWPDHPTVDVLHYEELPPEFPRVTPYSIGEQQSLTWPATLARYLEEHNHDPLVMLVMDDYGLCAPPKLADIRLAEAEILNDRTIGNVHFKWHRPEPKARRGPLVQLPRWAYSINTQAAIWSRELLLESLQVHADLSSDQFELVGSRWFNEHRYDRYAHCQTAMAPPPTQQPPAREIDKGEWTLPYHNLMHRGRPCPQFKRFLAQHDLRIDRRIRVRIP